MSDDDLMLARNLRHTELRVGAKAADTIERLKRERDEARALAMHETEVARQEIRARTTARNAKRAAEEHEIRCAAELDEVRATCARHKGALLRIASGDAGDWLCDCPAAEIARAELDD